MNHKGPYRHPLDVPAENECPECKGKGYSPETAPGYHGLGSGCPRCLGTGRLDG